MGANQNSQQNRRFFKIIAKAEKANLETKQVICEQVKKNDSYEVAGWYSSLSGFITSISVKEIEYQGKKNKIIVLEFTDSTGIFQLEFSFSGASYSIINSLIDADFTKELEISGWIKDGKYVNCAVKYASGDKAQWSIPIEEQPKPKEFEHPITKKVEKDFTNVQEFWAFQLESVMPKAVKSNFKGTIAPKKEETASILNNPNPEHISDNPDLENLPF